MTNKSAKDILKPLYNRAYTILISAMNSQFRFETIIQSSLYYSDIGHEQPIPILKPLYNRAYTILISSVYRIYIYMNRHSDSSGK